MLRGKRRLEEKIGVASYNAPNHVGDLHEMVVHDVGKVVGRVAIRLDENEVAFSFVLLVVPVDQVRERWTTLTQESDDVAFTICCAACGLVRRDTAARPRVVDEAPSVESLLLVSLEVFGCTETTVRLTVVDELFGMLLVVMQSFRLLPKSAHVR